jgi:hypothetical protein
VEQVEKANQEAYHEVQKSKQFGNGNVQIGQKSILQSKQDDKRKKIELLLSEVMKSPEKFCLKACMLGKGD